MADTLKWQAQWNDRHTQMTDTLKWRAQSNGRHTQMTDTMKWQTHSNDRHNEMVDTLKWQTQSNDRHNQMADTMKWQTHSKSNDRRNEMANRNNTLLCLHKFSSDILVVDRFDLGSASSVSGHSQKWLSRWNMALVLPNRCAPLHWEITQHTSYTQRISSAYRTQALLSPNASHRCLRPIWRRFWEGFFETPGVYKTKIFKHPRGFKNRDFFDFRIKRALE